MLGDGMGASQRTAARIMLKGYSQGKVNTKLAMDANSPNGFVLMVEAASIDKQAHNMDTERMILETIEFDHAIKIAKDYPFSIKKDNK